MWLDGGMDEQMDGRRVGRWAGQIVDGWVDDAVQMHAWVESCTVEDGWTEDECVEQGMAGGF